MYGGAWMLRSYRRMHNKRLQRSDHRASYRKLAAAAVASRPLKRGARCGFPDDEVLEGKKMRILILGGTVFLGPHLIEAALARGHQITIFNRGQHNPDRYPEVEQLRGDRSRDVEALHGRRWDSVIDTCGYVPGVVRKSAELLANAVEHYTFISSVSVYANFDPAAT